MPRPPRRARRDRVSGWVRVELVVRQDGTVHGARVLDAEPAGLFEDAVLESVRRWRFAPYDTPRRTPRCASEQLFRFEWDRAPPAAVG